MSWASFAALVVGAKPIYLYRIKKDSKVAFYTSRGASVGALPSGMTINMFDADDFFAAPDIFSQVFSPMPISHSVIRTTHNLKKKTLTITVPRTTAIAQEFIGELGISTSEIGVWQGFEDDTDGEFVRLFLGEVQVVKPSWAVVSLVCEDLGSAIRGKGLSAVIQRPCRHSLYHTGCTLKLADHQTTGSATAITSNVVTVTEASAQADGYYTGGILSYGGTLQLITKHEGTQITMLGKAGTLIDDIGASGTQSVLIAPGCNRSMSDCNTKFDNSLNFGGFRHLTDSPFDGRSMA